MSLSMRRSFVIFLIPCLVSSCMVGPDYTTPHAPAMKKYTARHMPAKTVSTPGVGPSGKIQYFDSATALPREWWRLFHSKTLQTLVITGIDNSPTLAAAKAAIKNAKEQVNVEFGNALLPAFDANLGGSRQRASNAGNGGSSASSIFNIFNANAQVGYTFDIFGRARRQIEALQAQVDYQRYQWLAAYITLTSNIVTTSVTIASIKNQIQATLDIIKAQRDQLDIIKQQYELGGVSLAGILSQQTLIEQTRATLPPLQKSLAQNRHALAVLLGKTPNTRLPELSLDTLQLPQSLPVSLPSRLVSQRPDIQASNALLHAASAQIGVATANLLPQVTLTGGLGWQSLNASTLFTSANKVWSIGSNLAQPLFHGGALLASRRAAWDAFDQARSQYKQTVLLAFQNVADSLRAIEDDARTLEATRAAEVASRQSLKLTRQQYTLGGVSYIDLLVADTQYQQTRIARIQAQAARYNDTAALFTALGGGWWNQV